MRSSRSLALARVLGSQPGRISLVRALSSQAREGWRLLPSGLRVRHVKSGELGDDPVDVGQTVRVQYSARLEDGREVVSKLVASFRVGGGGVCAAIDDGVVGMRVGDRVVAIGHVAVTLADHKARVGTAQSSAAQERGLACAERQRV